jgi:hypothetical protein
MPLCECRVLPEPGPQPRLQREVLFSGDAIHLFDIEIVFMYPWAVVFQTFVTVLGSNGTEK